VRLQPATIITGDDVARADPWTLRRPEFDTRSIRDPRSRTSVDAPAH